MIIIRCPTCQTSLQVGEDHAGEKWPCLACGQFLQIPWKNDSSSAEAEGQPKKGETTTTLGRLMGHLFGENYKKFGIVGWIVLLTLAVITGAGTGWMPMAWFNPQQWFNPPHPENPKVGGKSNPAESKVGGTPNPAETKTAAAAAPPLENIVPKELPKKRSLPAPSRAEIRDGTAINALIADLQKAAGVKGSAVLEAATLQRINVVPKAGNGNLRFFRDGGALQWPDAFTRGDASLFTEKERKVVELATGDIVARAFSEAAMIDAKSLAMVRESIQSAKARLRLRVLSQGERSAALAFLNEFSEALIAVDNGDCPGFGHYMVFALRERTIGEFINHLTTNGLKVGPGIAEDDAAYLALYRAILALWESL